MSTVSGEVKEEIEIKGIKKCSSTKAELHFF
jgi:hypothetical protein